MENFKTEFAKPITLEEVMVLHVQYGLALEINDGAVATAYFE